MGDLAHERWTHGGDPVDRIDPLGLDGWWIARPFYWAGWSSAGEYVNDTVDGSAELGGYYAARPSGAGVGGAGG